MPTNEQVINKAGTDPVMTTNSPNGLLLPMQAEEFLKMTFEKAPLSKIISNAVVPTLEGQYQTLDFPEHILEIREENKDSGNRNVPTMDVEKYKVVKYVTKFALTDDFKQENVERERFADTLVKGMSDVVALDREDLLINGDENGSDAWFKMNDGVISILTQKGKTFDATTDGAGKKGIELLKLINQAIEEKYDRTKMNWLMNPIDVQDWEVSLMKNAVEGGGNVPSALHSKPLNMDIVPIPKMPRGTLILMDPKKIQEVHTKEVAMRKTGPDSETAVLNYSTTWSIAFNSDVIVIRPEAACVATGIDFTK